MSILHTIDPVALELGPLKIHWYGMTYIVGFAAAWWLGRRRVQAGRLGITQDQFYDLLFYAMLGVILGGRVGYMLFYGWATWLDDPLALLRVWEGGMSFHGGMLGVWFAAWLWSRKSGIHFFDTTDFLVPLVPIGLGMGRLGNFIGGELWGRLTDAPWAFVFPRSLPIDARGMDEIASLHASGALEPFARHPSQLYQMVLEGVLVFLLIWVFSSKPRRRYAVSGLFAVAYGLQRIAVEFVRQPDADIGFLAFDWLTMGMLLSIPLIVFGMVLLWWSRSAPYPPYREVGDAVDATRDAAARPVSMPRRKR